MMNNESALFRRFHECINDAKRIVISTHTYPDADGIGSEIALCLAMRTLGKNAICVNEEPLLERYRYLDPDNVVMTRWQYENEYLKSHSSQKFDLFIVTDTNSIDRIGEEMKVIAQNASQVLFIDHHPCRLEMMGDHCIDTSKAATGELVGNLIQSVNVPLDLKMALPLYTAILIDTSSFRYPTVTGNTHRLIGSLMDTGLRPPHAYNMIYGTKKLTYMKLLGKVLEGTQTAADEQIAWLTLSEDMLSKFQVDTEDTLAFINHLLILDNIKVAIMFREMGPNIKVSLRSVGNVDVGAMARSLGGGGHEHSAATIIQGELGTTIEATVQKIQSLLNK